MKAILFDVDGTLLDSMGVWKNLNKDFLAKYNFTVPKLTKEEKGKLEALSITDTAILIAKHIAKDMSHKEILDYYRNSLDKSYSYDVLAKEGVEDLLKNIKDLGIKMAVASSTDSTYIEKAFKRLGIFDYFDFFATPDIVKSQKSKSDFWSYCIAKHGCEPRDIVLFDDALYALKAAKKEGIKTVGIKDFPYNKREWDDIQKEADIVLDKASDIDIKSI